MAERFRIRVRGIEQVRRALRRLNGTANEAFARELFREGETIMTESKQLVPVDSGALRSTGHVTPPVREAGTLRVTLAYGGPAGAEGVSDEGKGRYVGYALHVHEDLTARHTVGGPKFLERPALEATPGMATRMAVRIQAALDREGR